jgi:hypothetical protein
LRPRRPTGYKGWSTAPIKGKDDVVAEPHSRVRSWGTIAAFTLIIALTIGEGLDEGFSVWDWLVMLCGVAAILQAVVRLDASRSAPT